MQSRSYRPGHSSLENNSAEGRRPKDGKCKLSILSARKKSRTGRSDEEVDGRLVEPTQEPFGWRERPQIVCGGGADHAEQADGIDQYAGTLQAEPRLEHADTQRGARA